MPMLTVGDVRIPYVLSRSATASRVRITVTPEIVEVVAPEEAADGQIAAALHRRRRWIYEHSQRMREAVSRTPSIHRFASGAKIPFRGRQMRLTVRPADVPLVAVTFRNGFLVECPRTIPAYAHDRVIEDALWLWLRKRLREDVTTFVHHYADAHDLRPREVRIKDQRHLWGSCGQDRTISLNRNLIFAPKPVLEYAVVHELCHLRHRTHGRPFWGLVGTILGDYEVRKAWLERNEHLLGMNIVGKRC